jgi:hypothetical protein
MTDKLNRVELDANECEEVVGGMLRWPRNTVKHWDECANPDKMSVRYRCLRPTMELQKYEKLDPEMKKMTNVQKIDFFLSKGWIERIN